MTKNIVFFNIQSKTEAYENIDTYRNQLCDSSKLQMIWLIISYDVSHTGLCLLFASICNQDCNHEQES
jgi:hypothetical protein